MTVDYIVASLPALAFDQPPPISWERFWDIAGEALTGKVGSPSRPPANPKWLDLETQMKNAIAEARGGSNYKRPASGCSLYWQGRVMAAFQERDPLKRETLLDKIWWDAAGELVDPTAPLGRGALNAYAVRLKIALKRGRISADAGNAAFDRLTAETKR